MSDEVTTEAATIEAPSVEPTEAPIETDAAAPVESAGPIGENAPAESAAPAEVSDTVDADSIPIEAIKGFMGEQGIEIDGHKPKSAEYAQFREQQRKERVALEEERAAFQRELDEEQARYAPALERARAMSAAYQAGDLEAFAKASGLFESYEQMTLAAGATRADPAYRRVRELEQRELEEQRLEQQRQREIARQQQMHQWTQRRRAFEAQVAEQLAKSSDPLCRENADDPVFVRSVAALHHETKKPLEEVARMRPEAKTPSAYEMSRALYDALEGARLKREAAAVATAPLPAKRVNRTHVVKGPAVEPAATGDWKTDKDFIGYAAEKMKNAFDEERAKRH